MNARVLQRFEPGHDTQSDTYVYAPVATLAVAWLAIQTDHFVIGPELRVYASVGGDRDHRPVAVEASLAVLFSP